MSRTIVIFLVIGTLGLAILLAMLGLATLSSNLLGWFLLITGLVYFLGIIIVYWVRQIRFWSPRAKGETISEERNDGSFWLIVIGMIAVFYVPPIEYLLFSGVRSRAFFFQIPGLFLILLGSTLFLWARRTLGEFYSGHVSVIEGQPLVQHGPYHFIRHPAYAGYLLIALGLVLGYGSLTGLAAVLFLLLPAIVYRIQVEDKLLAERFGAQFAAYARATKRLLPYVW